MNMKSFSHKLCTFLIILFISISVVHALEFQSKEGFSLFLPNGFWYSENTPQSQDTYSFDIANGLVCVDIAVYKSNRFSNAEQESTRVIKQLKGQGSFSNFSYNNTEASIGNISFANGKITNKGFALFLNNANSTPDQEGKTSQYDLMLLVYSQESNYDENLAIIESAFDSFCPNIYKVCPGPLSAYERSLLTEADYKTKKISVGKTNIEAPFSEKEAEIAQYVVEREYIVLLMSTDPNSSTMNDGISRFYQMIYRDSAQSLNQIALELNRAWETGRWNNSKINIRNTNSSESNNKQKAKFGAPVFSHSYASSLLEWIQTFKYQRDENSSDVINPYSAVFEQRGDCDSRALVLSILLKRANIDSILMYSMKYNHALAAVDTEGKGAHFSFGNKNWLVAETTAKVALGLIDSNQSNKEDWIGISFPR